jgi:hypothetical protein
MRTPLSIGLLGPMVLAGQLAFVTPPRGAEAGAGDLAWTEDGTRLVVGNRWVLDPERGAWAELPRPSFEPAKVSVSPGGRRLVAADAERFAEGPVEGPLGEPVPIPQWAGTESGREDSPGRADLDVVLFWLDEERIFVQQTDRLARVDPECRIWEVGKKAWAAAPGCVTGDFNAVWAVERGPRGWIAVDSAGEGHPGVNLARYDAQRGQQPQAGAPEFDLYPFGPLFVQFRADGSGVLLSTPCVLERKEPRPCEEPQGAWRVYSWAPGASGVKLEHEGLPEGVMPSPDGQRLAWAAGSKVCVGRDLSAAVCLALPAPAGQR